MVLLAKRSIIKEDKSNIITLGQIAKEEKKKDPSVVNATIGMLYDEKGKLFAFESVEVEYPTLYIFELISEVVITYKIRKMDILRCEGLTGGHASVHKPAGIHFPKP